MEDVENGIPKRFLNDLPTVEPNLKPSNVRHSVNVGDITASLIACKRFWELTDRKIVYMQTINFKGQYYPGAVHPTVNELGENVCVNNAMFDMIKPLVEAQPYIERMEKYQGQRIDLDFDVIRGKTFVNLPNGSIQSWLFYAFPDLACDISKPWISLPDKCPEHILKQSKGKVIVNFTERYRNEAMDYFYLRKYASDLVFAGTEREHWLFCNKWQLNIPRLQINDFLEYAHAIKECKFILCNQSLGWNISAGLGTPHLLEICSYAPNCLPFYYDNSFGYFHQVGNEYYFREMYNKLS